MFSSQLTDSVNHSSLYINQRNQIKYFSLYQYHSFQNFDENEKSQIDKYLHDRHFMRMENLLNDNESMQISLNNFSNQYEIELSI